MCVIQIKLERTVHQCNNDGQAAEAVARQPLLAMLQIFRDGSAEGATEYEGPREAAGIVSYLRKQAGPPSLLLEDAAAVKAFRAFDDEKDTVGEVSDHSSEQHAKGLPC
jgi:hypothetical protein